MTDLSGLSSGLGALLSELFPSRARSSAPGFCYNVGRACEAAEGAGDVKTAGVPATAAR